MSDKVWFKKGLRFECTGCGDCCTGAPGFVWVNSEEIRGLAKAVECPLRSSRPPMCVGLVSDEVSSSMTMEIASSLIPNVGSAWRMRLAHDSAGPGLFGSRPPGHGKTGRRPAAIVQDAARGQSSPRKRLPVGCASFGFNAHYWWGAVVLVDRIFPVK